MIFQGSIWMASDFFNQFLIYAHLQKSQILAIINNAIMDMKR